MTEVPPDELFEAPEPWPYDPAEDATERLADAMGDPTHPMHEKHYEAEEEAFTRLRAGASESSSRDGWHWQAVAKLTGNSRLVG